MAITAGETRETQLRAALVDHYHQSYELTYRIWEKRNSTYVFAVAAFFVTSVISIDLAGSFSILMAYLTGQDLGAMNMKIREFAFETTSGNIIFIMGYISLDLIAIYYLSQLYSREIQLRMMYGFLHDLESDLRKRFEIAPGEVAFSREGVYYAQHVPQAMTAFLNSLFTLVMIMVVSMWIALKLSPYGAVAAWSPLADSLPAQWETVTLSSSLLTTFISFLVLVAYVLVKVHPRSAPAIAAKQG